MGKNKKQKHGNGSKPKKEITMDPDKRRLVPSRPKLDPFENAIRKFEGDHEYLSNTFASMVRLDGDEELYPSVEHAFQASKTMDPAARDKIRLEPDAIQAKKLAREFTITEEWRAKSQQIMELLVRDKFRRHSNLRRQLEKTGTVKLVHSNEFNDQLWGVSGGKGKNLLGKLLEQIREDCREGQEALIWLKGIYELCAPADCLWEIQVEKDAQDLESLDFKDKAVLTFGKEEKCSIQMNHPSVSRLHAFLFASKEQQAAVFIDLGTRNGCYVNEEKIDPLVAIPITTDHVLRIGTSSRRFRTQVVTDLREKKRLELYQRMAEPDAGNNSEVRENVVFVGNLPYSVTKEKLEDFFGSCGKIKNISIPKNKETGEGRGIAFVEFSAYMSVAKALSLDGDDVGGRPVKVKRSDSKGKAGKSDKGSEKNPPNDDPPPPAIKEEKKPRIKVLFKVNDKAFYGKEKVRVIGMHLDKQNMRPYYTIKMQGGRQRQVLEAMLSREPITKRKSKGLPKKGAKGSADRTNAAANGSARSSKKNKPGDQSSRLKTSPDYKRNRETDKSRNNHQRNPNQTSSKQERRNKHPSRSASPSGLRSTGHTSSQGWEPNRRHQGPSLSPERPRWKERRHMKYSPSPQRSLSFSPGRQRRRAMKRREYSPSAERQWNFSPERPRRRDRRQDEQRFPFGRTGSSPDGPNWRGRREDKSRSPVRPRHQERFLRKEEFSESPEILYRDERKRKIHRTYSPEFSPERPRHKEKRSRRDSSSSSDDFSPNFDERRQDERNSPSVDSDEEHVLKRRPKHPSTQKYSGYDSFDEDIIRYRSHKNSRN